MSLIKFIPLLFLISMNLYARSNHMIVMGGGGEPAGKKTIFDKEIKNVANFVKKSNSWNVSSTYNGGHSNTEKLIRSGLEKSKPNKPFTQDSFEEMLSQYEDKIRKGEIKSGDQLLVFISSHGAEKKEGEKSHSIATSGGAATNLKTLEGSKTVSLDRLQKLIDVAKSKKIKLGILDFSCHSGHTLALDNPDTCIISSSGPENFAYVDSDSTFSTRFTKLMSSGRSLEEVFLKSFIGKDDSSFPMISSPPGKEIQRELHDLLNPYLYQWNPREILNKLSPYLEEQVIQNKCGEADESFKKIMAFSKQTESIIRANSNNNTLFRSSNAFKEFEDSIESYYKLQNQLRDDLSRLSLSVVREIGKESHDFCTPVMANKKEYKNCNKWTTDEIMAMDIKPYQRALQAQMNSNDPFTRAWGEAGLKNAKDAIKKREEIARNHPEMKRYITYYQEMSGLENKTRVLARKVAQSTQKIYADIYEERSKNQNHKNACKDFIL